MKQLLVPLLLAMAAPVALAKLPAPPALDDAAKAKAEETKAKSAWQSKLDAFKLCQSQDRAAAAYRKHAASKPAAGKPAAPAGEAKPTPVAAAASAPSATPAASAAPCVDPGPFAYTPPAQKPLEAAGAHSPTGTAVSPPTTGVPAAATPAAK